MQFRKMNHVGEDRTLLLDRGGLKGCDGFGDAFSETFLVDGSCRGLVPFDLEVPKGALRKSSF